METVETVETSAFSDKSAPPREDAVATTLGAGFGLWGSLRSSLAQDLGPLLEDWTFGGKRYGWSLRLARGKRPVVYLTPLAGRFRASLALPERAVPTVLAADLPGPIRALVEDAPRYPEGRAVRILVGSSDEVAHVVLLATLRMTS